MLRALFDLVTSPIGWARGLSLYLSKREILGISLDSILHFLGGAAIICFATARYGQKKAWAILAGAVIFKEVADLYLHASMQYMGSFDLDTFTDILCSIAGGALIAVFMQKSSASSGPGRTTRPRP